MSSTDHPFLGLLGELQRNQFPIGVDHHVRLARLMEQMGGSCDFASLKTILCPLIATSPDEQKRFYDVFDRYYAVRNVASIEQPSPVSPVPVPPSNSGSGKPERVALRSVLAAAVALVAIFVLRYYIDRNWKGDTPPAAESTTIDTAPPAPDTTSARAREMVLKGSTEVPGLYQRHYRSIVAGAAFTPLALEGLAEWLRHRRRRRRRHGGKTADPRPPYHWTIRAPPAPPWYRGDAFAQAVRFLRMREDAEHVRLDVERSVKATIDEGGWPTWQFRSDTRPPEYVFLVDRAGQRDHQARHYASLVKGLDDEDVFVDLWYFDRDPRICTTDSTKPSTSLADLARRRSGSRLVVFADGESLVDPISGQPAEWTKELTAWSTRAILTPRPPAGWGEVEIGFERDQLVVRPGTIEGLKAVGYGFAADTGPNKRHWLDRSKDPEAPQVNFLEDLEELRTTLRTDLYRWLCSCAVYPELHWDLTIELGRRLGGTRLLTEANLLTLARLPWFRAGAIPDRIRERLIADLDPEVRRSIHQALAELLERDPPDEHSFAAMRYAENLAVQRLGAAETDWQRRGLMARLQSLAPERLFREAKIAGLEARLPRSPFARVVPRVWWRRVFEDGEPLYGLTPAVRTILAAAVALLTLLAIPKPAPVARSFRFVPDTMTLTLAGPGLRLSITADSVDPSTISVEDTTVGSLDGAGYLHPRAAGDTRLHAVRLGDTATARIAVVDVLPLTIVPASPRLVAGDSVELEISNPATRAIPSWQSENPRVASVSSVGRVRAIGPGETRVVVRRGSQSGSATVTVVPRRAIGARPPTAAVQVGDTVRRARDVSVPDLVGYTRQAALDTLRGLGLTPSWRFDTFAPDSLFGRVTTQGIAAGQVVASGTEIPLRFGAGRLVVPDVVGLTVESAQATLSRAGLRIRLTTPDSAYGPRGVVERQSPAAGTRLPPRGIVDLTVSTEPSVQIEQRGPKKVPIDGLLSDYVGTWADKDEVTYTFGLHLERQPTGTYSGFFVYTLRNVGTQEDLRPLVGATGTEFVSGTYDNRTDTLRLVGQAVDDSVLLGTAVYLLHFPSGRSNFSGRTRNTNSGVWSGRITGQSSSRQVTPVKPTRLRPSVDSLLSDYVGTWANADNGSTYTFGLHLERQPTGTYSGFFVYTLKDVGKREDLRPLVGATGTEFVSGTFDNRTDTLRLVGQAVDDSLLLGTAVYLLHLPAGRSNFSGRTRNTNSGDWSGRITGQRSSHQVTPVKPTRRGAPSR